MPHGMASTQRLTTLARGVKEAGADVMILLTRATEQNAEAANNKPQGKVFGIPFFYALGTPVVAATKLGRRIQEWRGLVGALRMLGSEISREGVLRSDVRVITYSRHLSTIIPFALFCRWHHISIVAEMCEWPLTQSVGMTLGGWRRRLFCRNVVRFIDGALPISRYIERQMAGQALRLRKALPMLYIPILVDAEEPFKHEGLSFKVPYVLFSGSVAYRKTIEFVLDAFMQVSRGYPELKLVLTGIDIGRHTWLRDGVQTRGLAEKTIFPGFITRNALLTAYRGASALLVPLFGDTQSLARFPTKLAEYLLSGRPVVTNRVGDVADFLENNQTAILVNPDDTIAFAEAILYVLEHQEQAESIAQKGCQLAKENFDYRNHGKRLYSWLGDLG
jgi:glycosyltransferase involved in cell wall biosynthesis